MAPSSLSSLKASFRVLGHRSVSLSAVAYFKQSLTASIDSTGVVGCWRISCCRHIVDCMDKLLFDTRGPIGPSCVVRHPFMIGLSVGCNDGLSLRDYVVLSNLITGNAKKWPNKWSCRHCRLHAHAVVNLGITTPLIYAVSFLYKVITEVTRNSRIDHRTRTRHRRHDKWWVPCCCWELHNHNCCCHSLTYISKVLFQNISWVTNSWSRSRSGKMSVRHAFEKCVMVQPVNKSLMTLTRNIYVKRAKKPKHTNPHHKMRKVFDNRPIINKQRETYRVHNEAAIAMNLPWRILGST